MDTVGIKEGEALPDDYIEKKAEIAARQIVLGGYRLSNLLKTIFDSTAKLASEQESITLQSEAFLQ